MKRHEAELAVLGAIERMNRKTVSVKEMIDQYLDEYERVRPLGKTKRATLTARRTAVAIFQPSGSPIDLVLYRASDCGDGIKAFC